MALGRRGLLRCGGAGGFCTRKGHDEGAALTEGAVHLDGPPELLHHAVAQGEPEPGAAPEGFGGEVGLEDPGTQPGLDAGTGVLHPQTHVVALEVDGDVQLASARHGIAAVPCEVQGHLLKLRCLGTHPAPFFGGDRQLDVLSEETVEEAGEIPRHLSEVHGARGCGLTAAEGEELLGELGGPVRAAQDQPQELVAVGAVRALHQQLGRAPDGGEQVVEVVGDPAGEATEGLEPLAATKPLLEFVASGDVGHDAGDPHGLAIRSSKHAAAPFEPTHAAIGAQDAVLHIVVVAALDGVLHRGRHPLPILLHDLKEEALQAAGRPPFGLAEHLRDPRGPTHHIGEEVPGPVRNPSCVHGRSGLGLPLDQLPLGLPSSGRLHGQRRQIADGRGEGLLLVVPVSGRADVLVADHADNATIELDLGVQHGPDVLWEEVPVAQRGCAGVVLRVDDMHDALISDGIKVRGGLRHSDVGVVDVVRRSAVVQIEGADASAVLHLPNGDPVDLQGGAGRFGEGLERWEQLAGHPAGILHQRLEGLGVGHTLSCQMPRCRSNRLGLEAVPRCSVVGICDCSNCRRVGCGGL